MKTVEIKVFCIAQTRANEEEVRAWLDHVGAIETPVPRTKGDDAEATDAGAVCGLCAKRCYMSFEPGLNPNVTKVRRDWHDYLVNILKSGHGSVTEHATWSFAIEGVSRVFTGELNRHRAGVAISEGSMRYIRFDDIVFWMPHSIREDNRSLMPKCSSCKGRGTADRIHCMACAGSGHGMDEGTFRLKKAQTRKIFERDFSAMETTYSELCELWNIEGMNFATKKKLTSLFRRLIGMGVATGGTWTFNVRALRHVVALRTSPHAEEEIAHVIGMIGKRMFESEPALFGDFKLDEITGAWVPEYVKV